MPLGIKERHSCISRIAGQPRDQLRNGQVVSRFSARLSVLVVNVVAAKNPPSSVLAFAQQLLRRPMDRFPLLGEGRLRSKPCLNADLNPDVAATKRRFSTVANRNVIATLRQVLQR